MFAGNHGVVCEPANVHEKYATTAKKTPKMIARVLGLIDFAIRLVSLLLRESDILHPLLLIFDIRSPAGQRYIPAGVVPRAEEGWIPSESAPMEGPVARLPDPGEAVGGA